MLTSNKKTPLQVLFGKLEDSKDRDGYTLIEHVKEIFNRIILNPGKYPLDKFEEVSYLIKLTRLKLKQPLADKEVKQLTALITERQIWIQKYLSQLAVDKAQEFLKPLGVIPNIMAESKMFQWAGVSIGDDDWYLIYKAVKLLSIQTGCAKIRFWGKILCKEKDVYVIEMKANNDEDYACPPGEEKRGKGLNENVYWVTNNLLSEWQRLPDVKVKDIVQARLIKKMLTGNLDAPVNSYPFYSGKEEALLRAQIARITASTIIVPGGVYAPKAAENSVGEVEFAEEAALGGFAELKGPEKWVHYNLNILKNGRTEYIPRPGAADPAADIEEQKTAEAPIERLKAINEDEKVGALEAWRRNVYGDEQQYNPVPPKTATLCYGVIALRPVRWPGAITVYQNGKWQSLYVGYGIKNAGDPFVPIGPAAMGVDQEDPEEAPEPNPQKLPDPVVAPNPDQPPADTQTCLLYTSPSPRDATLSRMPSSA
eukprot:TRINITY_DN137_c0_g1_i1.p1 TRINITY_DN137_c0_g1~~TRINITY_DN137_c0_g1_i1.p1  ORF type:complete len:482 (-),score=119.79 TRINITY_DN137_c0_g1_i1:21-1466(-)